MDGRGIEVAVQLSASYLRRSFQLLAQVSSNGVSAEAGFERAADLVYAWGRRKYVKIFRDMPEEKANATSVRFELKDEKQIAKIKELYRLYYEIPVGC